jgi:hypothetical protein
MLGVEIAIILPPGERPTIKAPTINREAAPMIDLED